MAAITRRTWDLIEDEVISRLGNRNETGFDTRVQHWITSAYRRICAEFYHPELLEFNQVADTVNGTYKGSLPSDTYIVMGCSMGTIPGVYTSVTIVDPHILLRDLWENSYGADTPEKCARFNDELWFNGTVDQPYNMGVFYYKFPAAPDFAAGVASPEISWLWDEAIIELAVALGSNSVWQPDIGIAHKQTLSDFMKMQAQSVLAERPIGERPHLGRSIDRVGGEGS